MSVGTLAGRATADSKLAGIADGIFFAPADFVFVVRRILRTLRPSLVAVAETEIWPNLFREVKRSGAGLMLVNGRISDKAFPRYLRWRGLFAAVMPQVDTVQAQTDEIARRFIALGTPAERVQVVGNFKFDFAAHPLSAESQVNRLLARLHPSQIWIAASTVAPEADGDPDEDDAVIAAFRQLAAHHPGLLLILAPRKPERFDGAAQKLDAAGLRYLRRSQLAQSEDDGVRVLLLDSIGELGGLFGVADVVFMGGTLARRGGHNILEPALFGKPVVTGPHMENFQAIADDFRAASACVTVASAAELAGAVDRLLRMPEEARQIGGRGLACAEAKRGASRRAVEEVRRLRTVPHYRPALPWLWPAWLLARIWEDGARRRQLKYAEQRRTLPVPVISVGNLTMGGTGKTPCVLLLAERLRESGRRPGILTRGYGRQSPDAVAMVAEGESVSALVSGDEAQIFIRAGVAPVGIGADRVRSGMQLVERFGSGVLLLDDGFQHTRLARDLDIVLLDALQPFGGGDVFPLGRLREPVAGMARAGMVVITRCELSDLADTVEREVRRWNREAPVFRASTEPVAWVEYGTGRPFAMAQRPFGPVGAFCGLGNPAGFRRTLEGLGVEIADWIEFDDHHKYRLKELRHVAEQMAAAGATALLTTEKDSINLCEGAAELVAPLSIYWLQIGMRIEGEETFLGEVDARVWNREHQ